ncbi:hypothetical protein DM819_06005 [Pseudomonas hunanensis]|uniref:Uncharacterized protein n=1 Tax=Pseudomonas hunanensis TaxID=1247546 RepID=A0ABD6MWT5_9PSED|nr:hypothetical protein [Pseudomonas hunanensis]
MLLSNNNRFLKQKTQRSLELEDPSSIANSTSDNQVAVKSESLDFLSFDSLVPFNLTVNYCFTKRLNLKKS